MPTIGEAVGALEARLFVGRDGDLRAFETWLSQDTDAPAILNVTGPGGIGKTSLLGAFARTAEARGRVVAWADGRDIVATPDAFLGAVAPGAGSVDAAARELNRVKPLLVIDTFEELEELTRFLQLEFLPKLDTEVRVVVAGRYPLGRGWSAWQKFVRPLPLRGFSSAETVAFLERRGIGERALVDGIVDATGGMPLAVSLAADMVVQLGVRRFPSAREWPLVVRTLVERLLEDVEDPALRELLEACSVLRQFDEQTLAAVAGSEGIGRAFDRLCRLSVLRPGEHGLMLHEDIRRILSDDLRWRRPERYRELRTRALAHYRERVREAPPGEREWLVAERLYLWGNDLIQAMMFRTSEAEEVHVEPADGSRLDEIREVWERYLEQLGGLGEVEAAGFSVEDDRAWMERLVAHPAARLRVARDDGGVAVGFNSSIPMARDSIDLVRAHPVFEPLVTAYFGDRAAELADHAAASTCHYILQTAVTDARPEEAQAALLRDLIGLFVRGGVYMTTVASPERKRLCEAIGFRRIEGARVELGAEPAEGYVLDLSEIGVEAWLEAIVGGNPPPRRLTLEEVQDELQRILPAWSDDDVVGGSALAGLAAGAGGDEERSPAEHVRRLVEEALERARSGAGEEQEMALRAVELAYLRKSGSHERVAERLAVSRSTFYRLLRRGTRAVAAALRG